jgi:hypothetical protein
MATKKWLKKSPLTASSFLAGVVLTVAGLILLYTQDPTSISYNIWDEFVGAGAGFTVAGLIGYWRKVM